MYRIKIIINDDNYFVYNLTVVFKITQHNALSLISYRRC